MSSKSIQKKWINVWEKFLEGLESFEPILKDLIKSEILVIKREDYLDENNESISQQNVQYHYGATLLGVGMLFFTKPKLAALGHSNPFTRDQVTLIVTSTGH